MALSSIVASYANSYLTNQNPTNGAVNRFYTSIAATVSALVLTNLPVRPLVQYGDFSNVAFPFLSAIPARIGKSPRLVAYNTITRFGQAAWPYGIWDMLTLDSYGFLGRTSSAYYMRGIAGNTAKLPNSAGVIEMAFIMGLTSGAPLGSNLRKRMVNAYSNVQSANRFSDLLGGTFQVVPSITGKRRNVSPLDLIWTVYH